MCAVASVISPADRGRRLSRWRFQGNGVAPRGPAMRFPGSGANLRKYYNEDRWLGQSYFPILIVEKDTLEPVCKPIAQGWQMPFASSRGYGSLTLQHDAAELLQHRFVRTGQRVVVLFVSDLDPSGLDLQRAWEEALRD